MENLTLKLGHVTLKGDGITFPLPGATLLGESTLAITIDDTGTQGLALGFVVASLFGTSVTIASHGVGGGGFDEFNQLEVRNNELTTVTISGSERFIFGDDTSDQAVVTDIDATASSPTTIQSSLKLIDASATTGGVMIGAGATTVGGYFFADGESLNANVTITYTGLTIKGGSGSDNIENDAKNGVVTDGNGSNDEVTLGAGGAKATLGTGAYDNVAIGESRMGPNNIEAAGSALGDTVTFGAASTAELVVGNGAEAGSTASTASIGLTKVVGAAAGMKIDFSLITSSSNIQDETAAVSGAKSLNAAENMAVDLLPANGVVYFNYNGSEYFIATDQSETVVNSHNAIVKLVGVVDLSATNASGVVTLHG
jgi:hypothetical protein